MFKLRRAFKIQNGPSVARQDACSWSISQHQGSNQTTSQQTAKDVMQERCESCNSLVTIIVSCQLMCQHVTTTYRSFQRRSSQPITGLILTNKTVQENEQTRWNPKKQTMQNTAKQNYPGSVAYYDTQSGNEMGLFYNAPEPIRGSVASSHSINVTWNLHNTKKNLGCIETNVLM